MFWPFRESADPLGGSRGSRDRASASARRQAAIRSVSPSGGAPEVVLAVVRPEERADGEVGVEGEKGAAGAVESADRSVELRRLDDLLRQRRVSEILGATEVFVLADRSELRSVLVEVLVEFRQRTESDAAQAWVGPVRRRCPRLRWARHRHRRPGGRSGGQDARRKGALAVPDGLGRGRTRCRRTRREEDDAAERCRQTSRKTSQKTSQKTSMHDHSSYR